MNKYVSIENVAMRFETKKGTFEALRDINLGIDEGEFVSLIAAKLRGQVQTEALYFKTILCCRG